MPNLCFFFLGGSLAERTITCFLASRAFREVPGRFRSRRFLRRSPNGTIPFTSEKPRPRSPSVFPPASRRSEWSLHGQAERERLEALKQQALEEAEVEKARHCHCYFSLKGNREMGLFNSTFGT